MIFSGQKDAALSGSADVIRRRNARVECTAAAIAHFLHENQNDEDFPC